MSIRERRFNKIVNKVLREELQRGNLPSSKEFTWRVNQELSKQELGKPSLSFKPVRKQSLARAQDLNNTVDKLYDDLDTLYVSVIDQHNDAIKHFNKFDVEKAKLDYELKNLENQLKELILLYGKTGFLNSIYDVFVDLSKVDTAKTTAHVDIATHEVKIDNVKRDTKKISAVTTTAFEVSPLISPAPEVKVISGTTESALSDKSNATWQAQVLTQNSTPVPAYFHVIFNSLQDINRISLSLHCIKPTFIRIEISRDGVTWFKLPYYENGVTIETDYTFDFPTINVQRVRILMSKNEPDSEMPDASGQVKYSCVFGIKNLSFFSAKYATESEFYSTVLDAEPDANKNFTIDKVSLLAEEELPNGTDIKYYIALPPQAGNQPDWKAISPVNRVNPSADQIIDFKNISTSVPNLFSIDPAISIGEYELENLYANGIKFYKIGEISGRKIISGTERLFVGKNTWGVKYYDYQHSDHATHLPSINDWTKPSNQIHVSHVKITDGKPGLLLNKTTHQSARNYMFTLGAFSTKEKELVTITPASIDPMAIYMNGQIVYQGIPDVSTKVSLVFQNGWNEVVVLAYTRDSLGTANGATSDVNFDPRKYGSNVYAKAKPLTKVPIFDLRYNVMNNDYDKFSIIEANNKTLVVLNHAIPGLEYEFFYNYIDGTVKDEILFKAVLSRDITTTETSPKLKSYRLRFS